MRYISNAYMIFLRKLEKNNNKEWFHNNKERYEKDVNLPFRQLIQDLLDKISGVDPSIGISADDAIFRINRDMRFSKDKTPYKLFRSALISATGRKSKAEPGFYVELGISYLNLTGGRFKLTNTDYKVLKAHFNSLKQKTHNSAFSSKFESLLLTPESITFEAKGTAEIIFNDDLDDIVFDYWKTAKPLIDEIKTHIVNSR